MVKVVGLKVLAESKDRPKTTFALGEVHSTLWERSWGRPEFQISVQKAGIG